MICQVEILEDDEDAGEEVVTLAKEAMDTFVQFVQLNIRVKQLKVCSQLTSQLSAFPKWSFHDGGVLETVKGPDL